MRAEKSNLPFSSSSSASSEDEDDPPPVAQPVRMPPPPRRAPSPPPLPAFQTPRYSPAPYSPARSSSPSPNYTPTSIHTLSQRTCEERHTSATPLPAPAQSGQQQVPVAPSAPQHPALVPTTPPPSQPQAAPTAVPAAITVDPNSPPDPATITYYAPPGASFILTMKLKSKSYGQELAMESSFVSITATKRSS